MIINEKLITFELSALAHQRYDSMIGRIRRGGLDAMFGGDFGGRASRFTCWSLGPNAIAADAAGRRWCATLSERRDGSGETWIGDCPIDTFTKRWASLSAPEQTLRITLRIGKAHLRKYQIDRARLGETS